MTRAALDTIRVAHVIDTLNVGGAEQLLVEACRRGDAAGIGSTVIGLRPGASSQVADELAAVDAEVRVVGSGRRRQLLDLHRVSRLTDELRAGEFDVVHTHLRVATIVGSIAARRVGVPVVCTLHNVRQRDPRGVVDRVKDGLETLALRHGVDVVIGCGPAVAASHRDRVGDRPLVVVPNPVREIPAIDPTARDRLRSELADGADQLVVAVGRLTEQKDFANLVDAVAALRPAHASLKVVILGEGEQRSALERRVAEADLAATVSLPGNRTDVPAVLSVADLFVSSSAWEGLPLVLLEAMAAGAPIVATDVGDVAGVVGEAGVLVPAHDPVALATAIRDLVANPARAARLGSLARRRAEERHSAAVWVGRLREIYQGVTRR